MNTLYVSSAMLVGLLVFVVNIAATPLQIRLACLACPEPLDLQTLEVIDLADIAVRAVKNTFNSPHEHRLIRVVEGTRQYSSGKYNFELTVDVGHNETKEDKTQQVTQRCKVQILKELPPKKDYVLVRSCNNV